MNPGNKTSEFGIVAVVVLGLTVIATYGMYRGILTEIPDSYIETIKWVVGSYVIGRTGIKVAEVVKKEKP